MEHLYVARKMPAPDWDVLPTATLMHMPWGKRCFITAKAQACYNEDMLWVRLEAQESPIRATLKASCPLFARTAVWNSSLRHFLWILAISILNSIHWERCSWNSARRNQLESGRSREITRTCLPHSLFLQRRGGESSFKFPAPLCNYIFRGIRFQGKDAAIFISAEIIPKYRIIWPGRH